MKCPKCGKEVNRLLALSRADNKTMICDECGTKEALDAAGLTEGSSMRDSINEEYCENCKEFARIKGIDTEQYGCPKFDEYFKQIKDKLKELCEPPKGEGYQLWNTTSEGSPISPVFETLDKLCEWCEVNATTFGKFKATKEEWKEMLQDGLVYHKEGNAIMF